MQIQQELLQKLENYHRHDREGQFLGKITEGNGNIKPAFELVTGVRRYPLDKFPSLQASQHRLHLAEK